MRSRVTLRLAAFEVAIFLVVILIGWTGYVAFRSAFTTGQQTNEGIDQTRFAFKTNQDECFRIADHVQAAVSELNQALFHFVAQDDSSEWEHFNRKSREVKNWIEEQKFAESKMKLI